MHIVLVSRCEKKAWANTRRIVDSYARRTGDRSWATPITSEGLGELHGMLKACATRQTAVACYLNQGVQRMKLMWVVGSRTAFSSDGYSPVAYTAAKKITPPAWFRDVSLIAQAAGYLHDWGKSSQDFADKLNDAVSGKAAQDGYEGGEVVRHEWLSYTLFRHAMQAGFQNAWAGLTTEKQILDVSSLKLGLIDKQRAMEFLIISHHKLFGSSKPAATYSLTINGEGHIKKPIPANGIVCASKKNGQQQVIDENLFDKATKLLGRAGIQTGQDYWSLVGVVARACLILADHHVSSVNYLETLAPSSPPPDETLYANTKNATPDGKSKRYDQPLNWHLQNVGEKAAEIAQNLSMTRFDGLSPSTVEKILERSGNSRFAWQDRAVDFLKQSRELLTGPALVFSGAGTGAGKTRANAKIVCALSDSPRFCVALNLRSLTLQTGDSMKNDLQIMPSEMAVVIGDRVVERMHRASQDAFSITGEDETEVLVQGPDYPLPQWLCQFTTKPKTTQLLMPPVLVSTIDFIINASEPGRQGHHALAMLRVMNSDLVLDELDSYDPAAMIAVLRLVQMSAMFGRNVVCSSATLSLPVANAVHQAFMSGYAMRKAAEPNCGLPLIAMVDDLIAPELLNAGIGSGKVSEGIQFENDVKHRHQRMLDELSKKPVYRKPLIVAIKGNTEEAYFETIKNCIDMLHDNHKWSIGLGRELSFGLVRVANIKTAINLARYLSKAYAGQGPKIACYHSNELRIQRHLKERRLDALLSRKNGAFKHICNDLEINQAFTDEIRSVPFIVIATPVEEIGRDHDFDWAVIEPSSAQSIVQACGRVNRHRLVCVDHPNVVILDKNIKAVLNPSSPCFQRPGIEGRVPALRYGSASIIELAGSAPLPKIDASFRLGDRPMATKESLITARRLKEGLSIICREQSFESSWMSQGFYQKYPLREFSKKDQYRIIPGQTAGIFEFQQLTNQKNGEWNTRPLKTIPPVDNAWLCWDDETLIEKGLEAGIRAEDAMFLELARYSDDGSETVVRDESFGFRIIRD